MESQVGKSEIKGHYYSDKFVFAVSNTTKIFGSFFLTLGQGCQGNWLI